MCTAISLHGSSHFFGRTLDLEFSYGESVVIVPRAYLYRFVYEGSLDNHSAIIGMAHLCSGTPLFYDAMNEAGLAMAALNFPGRAVYNRARSDMTNIASFELIPWVLSQASSVAEAVSMLDGVNITDDAFDRALPPTPLHWIIADRECAVVAEPLSCGLSVLDNSVGVLTNSPELNYHITRLSDFAALSPTTPENRGYPEAALDVYSRGMGTIGLPGGFDSSSRFVRAAYVKSRIGVGGGCDAGAFLHALDCVSIPCGAVLTDKGEAVRTVYASAMNTDTGEYFYTTYANRRIRSVSMREKLLSGNEPIAYPLQDSEDVQMLN